MCGIVALLGPVDRGTSLAAAQQARAVLAHRGPDGEGAFQTEARAGLTVTLAHRRLAIVDLSAEGAQPMTRGSLTLCFNGEIYNHKALRQELLARGVSFRGTSDTEVLLALIATFGLPDALRRCNGMFALLLWDHHTRTLWLARDRFGKKPLYYLHAGEHLLCASEIKGVLALADALALPRARLVDQATLASYLADLEYETGSTTFFRHIQRVQPGTLIAASSSPGQPLALHASVYYQLSPAGCPLVDGPAADEQFRDLLQSALSLRLHSDVPVAASLSGGLDSSSLVCLAAGALGRRDLQTLSVVHPQSPACDERPFIDAVLQHTGLVNWQIDPLSLLTPERFCRFLDAHDEPVGGASVFAQHALFDLAHAHSLHVVLSGQGADEVLGGYHGATVLAQASQLLAHPAHLFSLFPLAAPPSLRRPRQVLQSAIRAQLATFAPALYQRWLRLRFRHAQRHPAFFLRALAPPPFPLDPPHARAFDRRSLLHGYLYRLLVGTSLSTILRYEDRNSMYFGIETRAPFLDYRLVQHCLGRTVSALVAPHTGQPKALLRRALATLLPDKVRRRPDKLGFAAPEAAWLRGPLRPLVADLLASSAMRQRGLYNLPRLLAGFQPGAPHRITPSLTADSYTLWKALNVERWLRHHRAEL